MAKTHPIFLACAAVICLPLNAAADDFSSLTGSLSGAFSGALSRVQGTMNTAARIAIPRVQHMQQSASSVQQTLVNGYNGVLGQARGAMSAAVQMPAAHMQAIQQSIGSVHQTLGNKYAAGVGTIQGAVSGAVRSAQQTAGSITAIPGAMYKRYADAYNVCTNSSIHAAYMGQYSNRAEAEFQYTMAVLINTPIMGTIGVENYKNGSVNGFINKVNDSLGGALNVVSRPLSGYDLSAKGTPSPINGMWERVGSIKPTEAGAFALLILSRGSTGLKGLALDVAGGAVGNVVLCNAGSWFTGNGLLNAQQMGDAAISGAGGNALFGGIVNKAGNVLGPIIASTPTGKAVTGYLSEKLAPGLSTGFSDTLRSMTDPKLFLNTRMRYILTLGRKGDLFNDGTLMHSVLGQGKPAALFNRLSSDGVRFFREGLAGGNSEIMQALRSRGLEALMSREDELFVFNVGKARQILSENWGLVRNYMPSLDVLEKGVLPSEETAIRIAKEIASSSGPEKNLVGLLLGFPKGAVTEFIENGSAGMFRLSSKLSVPRPIFGPFADFMVTTGSVREGVQAAIDARKGQMLSHVEQITTPLLKKLNQY